MMRHLLCALCLFLAACDTSTGPGAGEQNAQIRELVTARAAWNTLGTPNYDVTLVRVCFCRHVLPVRVVVRNGTLVSATIISTGEVLAAQDARWYLPVEQMFDEIDDAIRTRVSELRAKYDAVRGYPTEYWIDVSESMADEEHGFIVTDFVAR